MLLESSCITAASLEYDFQDGLRKLYALAMLKS